MNIRILNRSRKLPEDGFYQIEALGEHVNHAAKVIQVIDAKSVESIVNRFAAEVAEAGEDFPGLRIDKDHLSQSMTNPTEALGWTMQLRNREGLPEARIKWTTLGRPLIEAKEDQPPVYKFFSTEFEKFDCEKIGTRVINRQTYDIMRPLRLAGLSLTNDPNNKGQRPISNRNGTDAGADNNQPEPTMKNIIKLLALAEDASEALAVDAIQTIINRATTAEAKVTSLQTERDGLLDSQVEATLEKHKAVIKNRTAWKAQLTADLPGATILLEGIAAATPTQDPAHITNRAAAKAPEVVAEEEKAAKEKTRGAKIANRAAELRKVNARLTRSQAFAKAEAEIPAE